MCDRVFWRSPKPTLLHRLRIWWWKLHNKTPKNVFPDKALLVHEDDCISIYDAETGLHFMSLREGTLEEACEKGKPLHGIRMDLK